MVLQLALHVGQIRLWKWADVAGKTVISQGI
jgi:hypothetical protein